MKKLRFVFCYYLVLLLASPGLNAQTGDQPEAEKWYQVEVFIYANTGASAATEESWPTELGLKYPEPLVLLNEALEGAETSEQAADTDAINSGPDLLTFQSDDFTEEEKPAPPEPFMVLDPEQRLLNDAATRILRQRDFRLLFHQAWLQQLTDRKNAQNIVIVGGERFDQHYELEGTIRVSVERYLHINTNLWLSTFVSHLGGTENPWPVLPGLPFIPGPLPGEESNKLNGGFFAGSQPGSLISLGNEFQALAGNQYSVERTVSFRQHRRMRSNELHYIDHPLLGLLVKISPYEPASETQAAEQ